jgi:hypothetical protein
MYAKPLAALQLSRRVPDSPLVASREKSAKTDSNRGDGADTFA